MKRCKICGCYEDNPACFCHSLRETSDSYVPEGYVQEHVEIEGVLPVWTEEDSKAVQEYLEKVKRGEIHTIIITKDNINEIFKQEEPFKLTEEEYQWLISLCCRSG